MEPGPVFLPSQGDQNFLHADDEPNAAADMEPQDRDLVNLAKTSIVSH
jgi:hypothetical protein